MKTINMQKIILVLIPVLFIFSGIQNSKADTFSLYLSDSSINTSFGYGNNGSTWEAVGTFQLDKASYTAGDTVYPSLSLTNFKNCMTFVVIPGSAGGGGGCTTSNAVLDSAGINAATTYSTSINLKNRGNLGQGAYYGTVISYYPVFSATPAPMDSVSPIASVNKIESFAIPAGTPATDTDNNYDFILNVNFLGAPFGSNIIFDVPITATSTDSCLKTTNTTENSTTTLTVSFPGNGWGGYDSMSCQTGAVSAVSRPGYNTSSFNYTVGGTYNGNIITSITCSPTGGFNFSYSNAYGNSTAGTAYATYTTGTTTVNSSTVDKCGPKIFTR